MATDYNVLTHHLSRYSSSALRVWLFISIKYGFIGYSQLMLRLNEDDDVFAEWIVIFLI